MSLSDPVTILPLVGPSHLPKLEKLGISTIKDLLFHFPVKYRDTSEFLSIAQARQEGGGTVQAHVDKIKNIYTRSRKVITRAVISDASGKAIIVWFNQPFITRAVTEGEEYIFELKLPKKEGAKDFYCSDFEKLDKEELAHLGRITPFYEQTAGISSKWLRARLLAAKKMLEVEEIVIESNIDELLQSHGMLNLHEAILKVHFPETIEDIKQARERLAFEEMLGVAMKIEKSIKDNEKFIAPPIKIDQQKLTEFINDLPYQLTGDQQKAINEVSKDLTSLTPMHRLLNGDVGSGKTVVAAATCYLTALDGYSSVIMAPTTILATQHYDSLKKLLKPYKIKVELLISGKKLTTSKKPRVIIGTHALLHEKSLPDNIAFVIVDEQHRFGVRQRHQLLGKDRKAKKGEKLKTAHYMTMTATPIPRTLTHILFGDMELSLIKQMPKNRIPIESHLVPHNKYDDCFEWIADKIVQSKLIEQAYIVFPLVEESEKSDLKAATKAYEDLSQTYFAGLKVGLLHGKLKEAEKQEVLQDFKNKKYNVLVSTTVVEVGIDVPDASIIVIENAERFGLAQLHQLRGRVGRGDKKSYCFVLPSKSVESGTPSFERLKYFCSHPSGFDVAEYDLASRGPGEVYGQRQSGLPNLKIADIMDVEMLKEARAIAKELLRN